MTDYPRIQVEDDRVIMRGEWATEIIYDVSFSLTENIDEFNELFEIIKGDHLEREDYYQGLHMMALIRRRSDGRVFGYPYWSQIGKYEDTEDVGPNGEEHGLEEPYPDDQADEEAWVNNLAYVWLPAEPYPVEYWRIAK